MAIMRKRPQIVDFDCRQARFLRPADDSVIQRPAKEVGKDRYNVDLHRRTRSKAFTTENTEFQSLFLCFSCSRLLLFFFGRQRRVQFQHSLGQLHLYLLALEVYALQICFRVRDLVALASRLTTISSGASPAPN